MKKLNSRINEFLLFFFVRRRFKRVKVSYLYGLRREMSKKKQQMNATETIANYFLFLQYFIYLFSN